MLIHNPVITGSLIVSGSITTEGQPAGTVASASYALTASYAENGGGGGGGDLTQVDTDITPIFDEVYDIGATDKKFYDAYLTNKLQIGDTASIEVDEDNDLIINSNVIISGSEKLISANIGDFGKLTISGSTIKNTTLSDGYVDPGVDIPDNFNLKQDINNALPVRVWSTGGALSSTRTRLGGTGEQDAALAFGGYFAGVRGCTEEYNGTSWSSQNSLQTPRFCLVGAGTQNAGLAFGGERDASTSSCTEEYDGCIWTDGGPLATARKYPGRAGTQDAALAFGGDTSYFVATSCTEQYDGSNWSAATALPTAKRALTGTGTQNAALSIGGFPGNPCTVYEYDGNVWATGGPTSFSHTFGGGATGTQDAGLVFGGPFCACTEEYDGISWSSAGALSIPRCFAAGAGTQDAGLAFSGYLNVDGACTEEYTGCLRQEYEGEFFQYDRTTTGEECVVFKDEISTQKVFTAGGALSTGRYQLAGAGTQDAGLAFGGCATPAKLSCTEEYDGTSWTAGGALPTVKTDLGGAGTQNAALAFAGCDSSSPENLTYEYDGSSWSSGGNFPTAANGVQGAGAQNAALAISANTSAPQNLATREYDGSSWSAGGNLISGGTGGAGAGTQTAALFFGVQPTYKTTQEYNGDTWATGGSLNRIHPLGTGAGTQNAGVAFGGSPGANVFTEEYNGVSWSESIPMLNGRNLCPSGAGTQNAGLVFGGSVPAASCTEEYSVRCTTQKDGFTFKKVNDTMHFIANNVLSGSSMTTDQDAEKFGVPIGGIYHCNGVLKIRLE